MPSSVQALQRRAYAFAAVSIGEVVQQNPRPHRRTQRASFDVLALGNRRLGLDHAVINTVALSINLSGENEIFPTGTCTSAVLVGAEFHLAGLYFLHGLWPIDGKRCPFSDSASDPLAQESCPAVRRISSRPEWRSAHRSRSSSLW